MINWAPDAIHVILITGIVSTVVGITVHVITRNSLSGQYLTQEDFERRIDSLVQKAVLHCTIERSKCPLLSMQRDITDIKRIQTDRTDYLKSKTKAEFNLWRTVLDKLGVPIDDQNKLLEGLA